MVVESGVVEKASFNIFEEAAEYAERHYAHWLYCAFELLAHS